jgi:hypothetical protein
MICGAIRGALEMVCLFFCSLTILVFYFKVQLEVECRIVQDQLKGDNATELRIKFLKKLEDALPIGED